MRQMNMVQQKDRLDYQLTREKGGKTGAALSKALKPINSTWQANADLPTNTSGISASLPCSLPTSHKTSVLEPTTPRTPV